MNDYSTKNALHKYLFPEYSAISTHNIKQSYLFAYKKERSVMEKQNDSLAPMPEFGAAPSPQTGGDENLIVSMYRASDACDVSGEITLPDYFDSAEKIMFVKAEPRLGEYYTDGGSVNYGGDVNFTVFFVTNEGDLKSVSFDGDIEGSAVTGLADSADNDLSTDIKLICAQPSCRLVSPRKISAKCRVSADICVTCRFELKTDINSDAPAGITLQRKSDQADALCPVYFTEEGMSFSDDIETDSSMPPAEEVISCSVTVIPDECKRDGDSIIFRGTAAVSCLCRCEGGGIMPLQKKFPISETFDAPAEISDTDECFCRAHITVSDITAEIAQDNFGENRVIELDFNFSAEVFCTCNRKTSLTRDIYSTDYKSDATYRTVELCRPCRMITSNFSVNAGEKFEFSADSSPRADSGDENGDSVASQMPSPALHAPSVIFCDASVTSLSSELDTQRGRVVITGTASVYMIVSDGNSFQGITFSVPLKSETDGYGLTDGCITSAEAVCGPVRGRADTSSVYADFEVMLNICVTPVCGETVIERLSIDKNSPFDAMSRPPILIYYPHKGEELWDIAKKYSTTVAALKEANRIQSDVTADDSVIIIPRRRK